MSSGTASAEPPGPAFECCGVRIDALTMPAAVTRLTELARTRSPAAFHLCNAYTLSLARRNADYAELLNRATVNLPDGTPVAWVGRWLGLKHLTRPTRGPDFMMHALRDGRSWGMRHYLFGGSPDVVRSLAERLLADLPGVAIVGVEAPPFRDLSSNELHQLEERVALSEAHVVWVGLGTPKQDHFVDAMYQRLGVPVVPVGAAFDFLAGAKPVAPRWTHHRGFEWIFRLASEPRRLWKRYLFGNTVFVAGILRGEARLLRRDGAS